MTKQDSNSAGYKEILDALKKLDTKVTVINTALLGAVEEDKPGLMERVRKIEEWIKSEKQFIYTITLIIIADVVMRLWSLVVGSK